MHTWMPSPPGHVAPPNAEHCSAGAEELEEELEHAAASHATPSSPASALHARLSHPRWGRFRVGESGFTCRSPRVAGFHSSYAIAQASFPELEIRRPG